MSSICSNPPGQVTQKLSKPPTNTSSSNLLSAARGEPEPVSPLPPSDADSADGYFPKMASTNGERRQRRNTRSKIRSYFHGQGQEGGQSNSSEDEDHSPRKLAHVARDMKRRISRNDSSTLLNPGVGASAASSSSHLFMADAHRPDLDEDEILKEQIKEKVWIDTLAAQNHITSPIDEDKHPDSVMTPIRRRSLYTPGIATRSPEDILRKPPPPELCTPQATRDYYYNPALPDSSPLSRLAKLKPSHNGRSTPAELDYTHLGALKLGTLRVTNGAASPVPRDQDVSPTPSSIVDSASQDDYYTASDGGKSEGERFSSAIDLSGGTPRVPPNGSTATYYGGQDTMASAMTNLCTNPLDAGIRVNTVRGMESPASVQTISPVSNSIKRKPLPHTATVRQRKDLVRVLPDSTCQPGVSDVADVPGSMGEVMSDSCRPGASGDVTPGGSPNKFQSAASFIGQKPEPDVWRSYIHVAEGRHANNGSREDAFLALTRNQTVWDPDHSATARPEPQRSEPPSDKGSAQYDSGYNSNESLESVERSALTDEARTSASSTSPDWQRAGRMTEPFRELNNDNKRSSSEIVHSTRALKAEVKTDISADTRRGRFSFGTDRNPVPTTSVQKQLSSPEKPRKLQKKRPKSQPPVSRLPMAADYNLGRNSIPPVLDLVAIRHSDRVSRFPVLKHTYSNLELNGADPMNPSPTAAAAEPRFPSPTQGDETSSVKNRQSLFQKLASRARSRSRSRPPKEQLPCDSDAESVKSEVCRSPSWSEYGNSKKKERKKREKAEREAQARSRSRSRPRKEQLPDNSDADSVKSELCRSPSWSEYGNSKKRERKRREKAEREAQKELNQQSSSETKVKSRSRSRLRSKSRRRSSQPEPVPTIADFGTVTESLGSNPYDIVRIENGTRREGRDSVLQPHHISTAKPPSEPREATSKDNIASGRSRSRSLAGQAVPFIDEGHRNRPLVDQKLLRPYSMYVDRPPMPPLPLAATYQRGSGPRDCSKTSVLQNTSANQDTSQMPSGTPSSAAKARSLSETQPALKAKTLDCVSHSSVNEMSATEPASMEQLVDELLDAPNAEARESILQQIRQQRHKSRERSTSIAQQSRNNALSPLGTAEAPPLSYGKAGPTANQDPLPSMLNEPQAGTSNRESGRFPARTSVRPQSLYVEAPPMPPLPTDERLQQQEARRLAVKSDRPKTLISPQKYTTEASKKDLWASCAIQTEHKKAIESRSDWEDHQSAWSQRRKSAGEALLRKDRTSDIGNASEDVDAEDAQEEQAQPPSVSTAGVDQSSSPKKGNRAFHHPWAPQDQQLPPTRSTGTLQPSGNVAATTQAFERITGRFEGGLGFNYEPGFGLGGSAGTRSVKTGATRKSLQMSQGYGVDLSDVPIFVAPSK
ncbi:MAG: hypothetical protein Q9218_000037 [Villophora microphyllina]